MKRFERRISFAVGLAALMMFAGSARFADLSTSLGTSPLPSWHDGPARNAIVDFVKRVTTAGGKDYVPEPERKLRRGHTGMGGHRDFQQCPLATGERAPSGAANWSTS
jgi:hypothetical protein